MPDLDGALHHPSHELAAATSVYTFSHAPAIIMSPKRMAPLPQDVTCILVLGP